MRAQVPMLTPASRIVTVPVAVARLIVIEGLARLFPKLRPRDSTNVLARLIGIARNETDFRPHLVGPDGLDCGLTQTRVTYSKYRCRAL